MKRFKKTACLIFATFFMMFFCAPKAYAGSSLSAITSDSIKEKQDKIKNSETERKNLESNLSNAKALKKELTALKNDLTAYITKIDSQITELEENIAHYQSLIADKVEEIIEMTAELEEAIRVQEEQYEAMKTRVRFMYERGDSFYLELMFSAKSFGDMLTKANYIERLSAYDKKKLDEYTAIREWTQLCKDTLEAEKEVLDAAEAALEAEEATLQEIRAEREAELVKYKQQIAANEEMIAAYEDEIKARDKLIADLEKAVLEEQKEIARQKGIVLSYDGGKFTWPSATSRLITDEFGWRTDPFTGRSSYHNGIDIGAAGGTAILAAYDGVVMAAAYDYSMGNYIMINHGDGLVTVYMHASKLLVKKDDVVIRGEQIGCVGTTGRSTGNHLHFSTRLNGTYVSPWPYLKGTK